MWTMTEEEKQNARGGVDCPSARAAQAQMRENAAKRRAAHQKRMARMAAAEKRAAS